MDKINKKDTVKNVIIILLTIAILILTFYTIFSKINAGGDVNKSEFLRSITELQAGLSHYLGSMSQKTFNTYTDNEIVTAKTKDNKGIKDYTEENLVALVNNDKQLSKNEKTAYQLNAENFKKATKIQASKYDSIDLYIQDGMIKINFSVKPEWWSSELDYLLVGNN